MLNWQVEQNSRKKYQKILVQINQRLKKYDCLKKIFFTKYEVTNSYKCAQYAIMQGLSEIPMNKYMVIHKIACYYLKRYFIKMLSTVLSLEEKKILKVF